MTFIYPQFNWGFTHAFSADNKNAPPETLRQGRIALYHLAFITLPPGNIKPRPNESDRGDFIAVPPCIILMAPVRNVDDAAYSVQPRKLTSDCPQTFHAAFHLPPAL